MPDFTNRIVRWRAALLVATAGLAAAAAGTVAFGADEKAPQPVAEVKAAPGTIGLVLTSWRYAFVETPTYDECGGKLDPGPVAQLRATPGTLERIKTEGGSFEQTGPIGESPQNSPLVFKDPLPVPEVVTKTGFGVNLDGTPDGRPTRKTCRHEKFTTADGQQVDNQIARVYGCVQGFRTGGQSAETYSNDIVGSHVNRHLIEVLGVDDEKNDPSVEIRIYKGYDRLVRTSDNKFVPGLSQRIDERFPEYNMRTTGRIVNGVLITDPIKEAILPHSSQSKLGDRDMRDMTMRLTLTTDGATGILAGYDNWRHVWNLHSKRVTAELNKMSSPTLYRRFIQYADGYPDKDGQCQFISAAYKVTAVRALIVHSEKTNRIASARN